MLNGILIPQILPKKCSPSCFRNGISPAALKSCMSAAEFSKKDLSLNEVKGLSMYYKLLSKQSTDGRGFRRQQSVMHVALF